MNAARRSFEAGIEAAPDYPPVYEALARLEWGKGTRPGRRRWRGRGVVPPAVGARREAEDEAAAAAAAGREVTF